MQVLAELERAESEYKELSEKKDIVEKDKTKIAEFIAELAKKKIEALGQEKLQLQGRLAMVAGGGGGGDALGMI